MVTYGSTKKIWWICPEGHEYEATITIQDGIVTGSLPRRALKLVYEWLDLHQEELMENWRLLSNSEAAKKISPLK